MPTSRKSSPPDFSPGQIVIKTFRGAAFHPITGAAPKTEPTSPAADDEIEPEKCKACGQPKARCKCAGDGSRGRTRSRSDRDRNRRPDRGTAGPADGQPVAAIPAIEMRSLSYVADEAARKVITALPAVVRIVAREAAKAIKTTLDRQRRR